MGATEAVQTMSMYCGEFCGKWRDQIKSQVRHATKYDVDMVFIKQVGPGQYDLRFQLYNPYDQHSILINWFGSACCPESAEAMAYQDYYENNF